MRERERKRERRRERKREDNEERKISVSHTWDKINIKLNT